MPQVSQVYVDQVLTNASIMYSNPGFVSNDLFPRVQVKNRTGIYYEYDKSKMRADDDIRAPGTRANRIDYQLIKRTYGPLLNHAFEKEVTDEEVQESADPLDPFMDATDTLTEKHLVVKEKDAVAKLSDTAVITQNTALTGTDRWNDYSASDPVGDVKTAQDTIHKNANVKANTLVMGYEVWSKIIEHPDILERIKYSALGVVTKELLAKVFDVDRIIVGEAVENSSVEGAADSMSYIMGKKVWLMYITPTPGLRKVSAGYTLGQGTRRILRWKEDDVEAEFVKVTDYYEHKIMAAPAIYYINTVID